MALGEAWRAGCMLLLLAAAAATVARWLAVRRRSVVLAVARWHGGVPVVTAALAGNEIGSDGLSHPSVPTLCGPGTGKGLRKSRNLSVAGWGDRPSNTPVSLVANFSSFQFVGGQVLPDVKGFHSQGDRTELRGPTVLGLSSASRRQCHVYFLHWRWSAWLRPLCRLRRSGLPLLLLRARAPRGSR